VRLNRVKENERRRANPGKLGLAIVIGCAIGLALAGHFLVPIIWKRAMDNITENIGTKRKN